MDIWLFVRMCDICIPLAIVFTCFDLNLLFVHLFWLTPYGTVHPALPKYHYDSVSWTGLIVCRYGSKRPLSHLLREWRRSRSRPPPPAYFPPLELLTIRIQEFILRLFQWLGLGFQMCRIYAISRYITVNSIVYSLLCVGALLSVFIRKIPVIYS